MKILKQRHFASGRKEEKGMGKRYIDCSARELAAYHKKELLQSIADSEGRVLAAETIGTVTPMLVNITNAEFVTSLGADIIMLDNMSVEEMKEAIRIIDGRAQTECSGNVTKENIARLTGLGVNYVSSGALTHSAPIMDISLKNLHPIE